MITREKGAAANDAPKRDANNSNLAATRAAVNVQRIPQGLKLRYWEAPRNINSSIARVKNHLSHWKKVTEEAAYYLIVSDVLKLWFGFTNLFRSKPVFFLIFFIIINVNSLSADVWVAADREIAQLASDGTRLTSITSVFDDEFSFFTSQTIAVNQKDGSVWVTDTNNDRIFRLTATGEPVLEKSLRSPTGIAVDPSDGRIWTSILPVPEPPFATAVVKLDQNGNELVRITGFDRVVPAISIGPSQTIWVAERFSQTVVKLFGTDEELNGYDASGESGTNHLRISGFVGEVMDLTVSSKNDPGGPGNVWVADRDGMAVKLSSSGSELVRVRPTGFGEVRRVSVNPNDASVWVADGGTGHVAKLSYVGAELVNLSIVRCFGVV